VAYPGNYEGIEDYILHFLHPGFTTEFPRTTPTYPEKICSCKFQFSLSAVVFLGIEPDQEILW
jgi:hypothetical protein